MFVASGVQHAMRMRHIVMWPVLLYNIFPHYLIKGKIFEKKRSLNIKCEIWFSLQILSETFFILRRNERDMIKNVYWYSCKVQVFLSDFNESWIFSTDFQKMLYIKISWKSFQWEPICSMQTDRRTGRHTDRRDGSNSRSLRTRLETCRKVFMKHSRVNFWKQKLTCPQNVAPTERPRL